MSHEKANDTDRVLPERGINNHTEEDQVLQAQREESPGSTAKKVCRKTHRKDLTAGYVRSLLKYYPETGEFEWLVRRSNVAKTGRFRGTPGPKKSYVISLDRVHYKAHRLAWLYMTGRWPTHQIDHINRDASDNRFANLREATNQENHCNHGPQSNNMSGHPGVFWNAPTKRWHAYIKVAGSRKHLGCFTSMEDALVARKAAEKQYFGEFAPC